MIDLGKAEKLPPEHRYFNISVLWIFYYRWILRLFYILKIPHELVTLMSIGAGLVSAYLFYNGMLLWAAIALHLKDIFDACDGALARLTGRGHLIGRYLDSLGDFLVLTAVMIAIGMRSENILGNWTPFWTALAIWSVFIQCSFFNYFQLAYLNVYGVDRLLSRQDENTRPDIDFGNYSPAGRLVLKTLKALYSIVYSWQDKFVKNIDEYLLPGGKNNPPESLYGSKNFMTLISPLCFGTHIFVIIAFALIDKPAYGLVFIGTVMNIYLLYLLRHRKIALERQDRRALAANK